MKFLWELRNDSDFQGQITYNPELIIYHDHILELKFRNSMLMAVKFLLWFLRFLLLES